MDGEEGGWNEVKDMRGNTIIGNQLYLQYKK
jgi:hypothetical protein